MLVILIHVKKTFQEAITWLSLYVENIKIPNFCNSSAHTCLLWISNVLVHAELVNTVQF